MHIYHYHIDTGEFISEGIADESPLEPGVFLIPAFATELPPLDFDPEKEICKFIAGEWVKATKPQIEPYTPPPLDPVVVESQRIAALWQAAHDYEYAEISGSAVGLLAMGVVQGKPKCIAVQNWIHGIWAEYYTRKAGTSTDTDYSVCGTIPHTVPELMVELGL